MDTAESRRQPDGPAVPAELTFLAAVLAMVLLAGLAGVPFVAEKEAADASPALRKGWLEQRQAEALAEGQQRPSRY